MSSVEYSNWKVADLKAELKAKGLPVSGNKQDLIDRLQTALLDDGDDLLDQDDSMTEEAIQKAEAELQMTKSPTAAKTPRTPAIIASPDTKKAAATPGKENTGPDANTATSPAAKMTPEEVEAKIKARAERFGGFQSDDAKKLARAAKFGITPAGGAAGGGSNKLGSAPAVDMDTLKKRAERFGGSTSNTLKKMEVDEAIKRRQERFGVVDKNEPKPKKISLNAGANSIVMDEKMKARQQRFGLA